MTTQQGLRQASVRAEASSVLDYNGDWHAMWDALGIASGTFNERMLLYINEKLTSAYTEINGAMAALAASLAVSDFGSIGTFDTSLSAPTITASDQEIEFGDLPITFSVANGNAITVTDAIETSLTDFTITVVTGTATLSGTTGLTFDLGDGTTDASMSFSGTLVDINTALEGMQVTGAALPITLQLSASHANGTRNKAITIDDTIGPVLSSPSIGSVGGTTASIGVTTDTGEGDLWWSITTSVTPPSAAAIKAGTGSADFGTQAVSGAGAISGIAVSGLSLLTTYYAHFYQEDDWSNPSNIVTSASFMTTDGSGSGVLKEDGDYLLQENGDNILLDSAAEFFLLEDGFSLVLENGTDLLLLET